MQKRINTFFLVLVTLSNTIFASTTPDDIIVDTIIKISEENNVNPEHMVHIAVAESSLIVKSRNKHSSAKGLFQITRHLEKTLRKQCNIKGNIFDIEVNTKLGICLYKSNYRILKKKLKRDPEGIEMYYAHFFGVYSAYKFINIKDHKNPCKEFKRESKHNKDIFYHKNVCLPLDLIKNKFYTAWEKGNKFLEGRDNDRIK